jgi:hypothetical protein
MNTTTITSLLAMPTLAVTASGGEVKLRRALKDRPGRMEAEIVLCYLPHNPVTPYVTWQSNVADGSTYWGHYYRDDESDEAVEDFFKR